MGNIVYTKELLQDAVDNSYSVMGVMRHLGLRAAGGTHSHISRRIKQFNIDTSHFGINPIQVSHNRKTPEEILVSLPDGSARPKIHQLRRALRELDVNEQCAECGLGSEWLGRPIQLEVDHIDGDWLNNLLENLRWICPNCHSQQTDTNKSWKNFNRN